MNVTTRKIFNLLPDERSVLAGVTSHGGRPQRVLADWIEVTLDEGKVTRVRGKGMRWHPDKGAGGQYLEIVRIDPKDLPAEIQTELV